MTGVELPYGELTKNVSNDMESSRRLHYRIIDIIRTIRNVFENYINVNRNSYS